MSGPPADTVLWLPLGLCLHRLQCANRFSFVPLCYIGMRAPLHAACAMHTAINLLAAKDRIGPIGLVLRIFIQEMEVDISLFV